uniref:Inositol polyphosphate-related phosphatase domain-containing protein n=1 Tax=Palpitomonas bilix TaxID=652834 RepID=A0A7S3LWS9_9EUKA|mmetsp:Transcript_6782/g.17044  ORF Transcript_6782/g.17044 Transcript_6782/m.17044 type:complete len:660 (+) Transcript_6782:78-2057(+)
MSGEGSSLKIGAVKIFCGTWNVNNQAPPSDLHPWLSKGADQADICALGLQEVDLTVGGLVLSETEKGENWFKRLNEDVKTVGGSNDKDEEYTCLVWKQMVGVALFVFVRRRLLAHIREVSWKNVGVGLMNVMGNKGGVGVRFLLYDTSIAFVSAHLAAHQNEVERRNSDYSDITRRMEFPSNLHVWPATRTSSSDGSSQSGSTTSSNRHNRNAFAMQGGYNLEEHDHVVWVGDLNYRIDMPREDARRHAKNIENKESLYALLEKDQLLNQKKDRKAFDGFNEADIDFAPTYKYDLDSDEYDTGEKKRAPAWTDRILWRSYGSAHESLHFVKYGRAEQKSSDHRPVYAILKCVPDPHAYSRTIRGRGPTALEVSPLAIRDRRREKSVARVLGEGRKNIAEAFQKVFRRKKRGQKGDGKKGGDTSGKSNRKGGGEDEWGRKEEGDEERERERPPSTTGSASSGMGLEWMANDSEEGDEEEVGDVNLEALDEDELEEVEEILSKSGQLEGTQIEGEEQSEATGAPISLLDFSDALPSQEEGGGTHTTHTLSALDQLLGGEGGISSNSTSYSLLDAPPSGEASGSVVTGGGSASGGAFDFFSSSGDMESAAALPAMPAALLPSTSPQTPPSKKGEVRKGEAGFADLWQGSFFSNMGVQKKKEK